MNTDSRKTGADYAKLDDRLPTVKLTEAEAMNLITTIHLILDSGEIRRIHVEDAFREVFGEERGNEYLRLFDAKEKGEPWSRRENVRVLAALYPYIPGETEDDKAAWAIEKAAPCFTKERWDNEVFPYVMERVAEYKAAGGTLDRWPEVVTQPEPEAPASDDAVPYENLKWTRGGDNHAGAGRDERVTITAATVHAGSPPRLRYSGDGLAVWKPEGDTNINAIACIFFDDDGDGVFERGGKFDRARSNAAERPMQHLDNGYKNWDGYPKPGTPWAYVLVDLCEGHRKRSNVVVGVWP
jgi:hypothetical protein